MRYIDKLDPSLRATLKNVIDTNDTREVIASLIYLVKEYPDLVKINRDFYYYGDTYLEINIARKRRYLIRQPEPGEPDYEILYYKWSRKANDWEYVNTFTVPWVWLEALDIHKHVPQLPRFL